MLPDIVQTIFGDADGVDLVEVAWEDGEGWEPVVRRPYDHQQVVALAAAGVVGFAIGVECVVVDFAAHDLLAGAATREHPFVANA